MSCCKQELLMLLACALWGSSYLFMKEGLGDMTALNLVAWRFGMAFLVPAVLMRRNLVEASKKTIWAAAIPGLLLYLLLYTVAEGVKLTSASNASFLLGTAVVLVPLLTALLSGTRLQLRIIANALFVAFGVWLLTADGGLRIGVGDLLCLLSASIRTIQIVVADKMAKRYNMRQIGILQLGWAALFAFLADIGFGRFSLPAEGGDWLCLLALGVLCTAVGFILQAKAQEEIAPEKLAIIFTTEPMFTALFALLLFGEYFTMVQTLGAVIILMGLIFSSVKQTQIE